MATATARPRAPRSISAGSTRLTNALAPKKAPAPRLPRFGFIFAVSGLMFRPSLYAICIVLSMTSLSACHSSASQPTDTDTPLAKRKALLMFKRTPELRTQVKKDPVAEYKIRTDDKLNEQYFSVRLYET